MTGIAEGAAAFGVLKSAYDLVRDLRKSNDPATLKAGLEEVTDRLLAAREDAFSKAEAFDAMSAENKRLHAELSKRGAWTAESARYQLGEIYPGSYAYVLRADKRGDEVDHKACATCFKNEKISILQKSGSIHLKCPVCETLIQFKDSGVGSTTVRRGRGGPNSWMGS